jgi:hypothetical protein
MKLFDAQGKVDLFLADSVNGTELAAVMDDVILTWGKEEMFVDTLMADGTMQKSNPFDFNPYVFTQAACGYPIVQQYNANNYYRISVHSVRPFKCTTELILENTPVPIQDICRDNSMLVGTNDDAIVKVHKINSRNSFTKFSSYKPKNWPLGAKFCLMDGWEMLLVVVYVDNAVHIVDHMDGGRFVRCLDTGSVKLNKPLTICTDYDKHVWIGCNGGKVVVVDLYKKSALILLATLPSALHVALRDHALLTSCS